MHGPRGLRVAQFYCTAQVHSTRTSTTIRRRNVSWILHHLQLSLIYWWWWLQHPSKDDEACAISGKRTTNSKLNTSIIGGCGVGVRIVDFFSNIINILPPPICRPAYRTRTSTAITRIELPRFLYSYSYSKCGRLMSTTQRYRTIVVQDDYSYKRYSTRSLVLVDFSFYCS